MTYHIQKYRVKNVQTTLGEWEINSAIIVLNIILI